MREYNVVLLEGDGAGPRLADGMGSLLERLSRQFGFICQLSRQPFGKSACQAHGSALPPQTIQALKQADGALLGAVDGKGIPGATPVGLLRRELELFADVRPIRARAGRWALRSDLDLVFIRECSQGFLSDRNLHAGSGEWMSDGDTAFSLRVITYGASRRIADFAFDYARRNGRKKLTALHKAGIFKMTCGTFLRACRDAARDYPEIAYAEENVDDAANGLISRPEDYDVLLTTNLFGDILSDEAAALVSSLAPTVNAGPGSRVYLPVSHSPAYGALESDTYDPYPALLCLEMMLENLGEIQAARALDGAICRTLPLEFDTTTARLERLSAELEQPQGD